MNTKTCPDCNCQISPNNYKKHLNSKQCLQNQLKQTDATGILQSNGKYKCPHCDKEYGKNGIGTHIWRKHGDGMDWNGCNDGYKNGVRKGTNGFIKGTQKEHSVETRKKIGKANEGNKHTAEFKKARSVDARKNNLGGHTSKKAIWYKMVNGEEVYLQSSYEVKLAKELDSNNIEWLRPDPVRWIDYKGVDHRYYPDFYLPGYDLYVDTKNDYLMKQDYLKIKSVRDQCNINLILINEFHLSFDRFRDFL